MMGVDLVGLGCVGVAGTWVGVGGYCSWDLGGRQLGCVGKR